MLIFSFRISQEFDMEMLAMRFMRAQHRMKRCSQKAAAFVDFLSGYKCLVLQSST
jgi:hypothetical protein